jgi:phosphotriesterase-related protein
MTMVETMRGQVAASSLGRTLMHEHVFVLTTDVQRNYPGNFEPDVEVPRAVEKLREVKAQGIDTIVDPTVVGLGRDIPLLQRVADQVDVNIVVATGMYTYDSAPFFFRFRGPIPGIVEGPDPMVEMFLGDIRDGIAGTGVRAGMLKCAIDAPGLTPDVERIMRAVAAAHVETRQGGRGVPITVHTHPTTQTGLEAHRVLSAEGVSPDRVVLGHSGDSTDADHLSQLADLGYVLGMDRFGIDLERSFDERVDIVAEMCRRGYAGQLVLSQDAACVIDWIDPNLLGFMPNWNYLHVLRDVVPALLERGVTEEQVDQMLVQVPRRVLDTD